MRVAFMVWTLEAFGGSERVVYDIATNLDKSQFQVLVISQRDGPIRNVYESANIGAIIVPQRSALDPIAVWRLRRILREQEVVLINAHHLGPFLHAFLATMGSRIRVVFTEHSVWQFEELKRPVRWLLGILLQHADAVVAVSKQLVAYYKREMPAIAGKVAMITNGIDLRRFDSDHSLLSKRDLGLPDGAPIVGIVANIRPEKNHKLLVRAFARLLAWEPDCHLVFAGADFMKGEVHHFVDSQGLSSSVHFLGARDDIPKLLRLFDVFCLPSEYEGLPLTVLEAMACGVPVVGSRVLGIEEVISNGYNGILVPPNDEEALAKALREVIGDDLSLRRTLVSNGLAYVRENHDLIAKVREYEKLFVSVLNS